MYNGVAAAFAPDLHSVQPIQQANQVRVSRDARFPLSGDTANLFSLEDSKTLCALLAAWPRFAASQWLLSRDDGQPEEVDRGEDEREDDPAAMSELLAQAITEKAGFEEPLQ